MNIEHLVGMSNQIGHFFESMPDREQALLDIALHLKKFWAPRMRHQLLDCVEREETPYMIPIVRKAVSIHAALIR